MPQETMYLIDHINKVADFLLESDLITAFAVAISASFAGAWAGARGAQKIAERAKLKDDIIKEIRETNAATSLALSIANGFLNAKEQNTLPIKNDFDREKERITNLLGTPRKEGEIREVVLNLKLETLPEIHSPIGKLQSTIFEKISVVGRPIIAASVLSQTIHSYNEAVLNRNMFIRDFQKCTDLNDKQKVYLLLGLDDNSGVVDQNYSNYAFAINKYANDCIYFCKLIIEDLIAHAENLKKKYKKQFKDEPPKITRVSFENSKAKGLMPQDKDYESWLTAFYKNRRI